MKLLTNLYQQLKLLRNLSLIVLLFFFGPVHAQYIHLDFNGNLEDGSENNFEPTLIGDATFLEVDGEQVLELDSISYLELPEGLGSLIDTTTGFEINIRFRILDDNLPDRIDLNGGSAEEHMWRVIFSNKNASRRGRPGIELSTGDGASLAHFFAGNTPNAEGGRTFLAPINSSEWHELSLKYYLDPEAPEIVAVIDGNIINAFFDNVEKVFYQDFKKEIDRPFTVGKILDESLEFIRSDNLFIPTLQIDYLNMGPLREGDADILENSLSSLQDHLQETSSFTEEELNDFSLDVFLNLTEQTFAANEDLIYSYMATFESEEGGVFGEKGEGFQRDRNALLLSELPPTKRAQLFVQQWILDNLYEGSDMSDMASLKFYDSQFYPGEVASGATRVSNDQFLVDGDYQTDPAYIINDEDKGVFRPTGYFVPAGELVTITLPDEVLNKGLSVVIGTHHLDPTPENGSSRIKRFPRMGVWVRDITNNELKVTNPFGGALYFVIPDGSTMGAFEVTISGTVAFPYLCTKPGFERSLESYLGLLAEDPVPWVEWESENFMTTFISTDAKATDDPLTVLKTWNDFFIAYNFLAGRPEKRIRPEYLLVDKQTIVSGTFTPASYPMPYGGSEYITSFSAEGVKEVYDFLPIFHEWGHLHNFPTLPAESESNVNLPFVVSMNTIFDFPIDSALTYGYVQKLNFKEATLDWLLTPQFRLGESMGNKSAYQARGIGKFVSIAEIFGWEAIGQIHSYFYENAPNPATVRELVDYYYGVTPDEYIQAASEKLGVNMAPLFELWGVLPSDELKEELGELPTSDEMLEHILSLRNLVPKNHDEYKVVYDGIMETIEDIHKEQYEITLASYNEDTASVILQKIDHIICTYFQKGCGSISSIDRSICPGDSFDFGGEALTAAGEYTHLFDNDSLVALSLEIVSLQPEILLSEDQLIVELDNPEEISYQWFDCATDEPIDSETDNTIIFTPGESYYVEVFKEQCSFQSNCFQTKTVDQTICSGDSFDFGGEAITNPGEYTHLFENDSLVVLSLEVVSLQPEIILSGDQLKVELDNLEGISYQWFDCATDEPIDSEIDDMITFTPGESYYVEVSNGQCNVLSSCFQTKLVTVILCDRDFIDFGGVLLKDPGQYTHLFDNDSLVFLTLETASLQPEIVLSEDQLIVELDNPQGIVYQWFDCATDEPIESETASSLVFTAGMSYYVEVSNGQCSFLSTCFQTEVTLGLDDSEHFLVYPNPVGDVLTIRNDQKSLSSAAFIAPDGKVVSVLALESEVCQIPTPALPGWYILKLLDQHQRVHFSTKIIILK